MRGSMTNMAMVPRVSHPPRPVYCSTKVSHSVGAQAAPSQAMLSQKSAVDKSGLPSSMAYPSDHSATANMSKQKATAPGAGRRCQAERASAAATTAETITGNTYGVNCQRISLPLSCLAYNRRSYQVPASCFLLNNHEFQELAFFAPTFPSSRGIGNKR